MFKCFKEFYLWKKNNNFSKPQQGELLGKWQTLFFLNYFLSLIYFQRHNLEGVLHSKSVVNTHSAVHSGELLKDTCNKDVSRITTCSLHWEQRHVSQWSYTFSVMHAEKCRRALVIRRFLRTIRKSKLVIVFWGCLLLSTKKNHWKQKEKRRNEGYITSIKSCN